MLQPPAFLIYPVICPSAPDPRLLPPPSLMCPLFHAAAAQPGRCVQVIDMPLLFETGTNQILADVIVVTCSPSQQLLRLQQRNGLTEEDARARVAAQMPMDVKMAGASVVIDNSGSRASTLSQVGPMSACLCMAVFIAGHLCLQHSGIQTMFFWFHMLVPLNSR